MIAIFFTLISIATGQSCAEVGTLPESLQVAWISPAAKTVGMNGWFEAVRVADLRAWVRDHGKDKVRLLRGVGMVGGRGGKWAAKKPYKVTIFDVKREWLCRPIEDKDPGTIQAGVTTCEAGQQRGLWGHKKGYTGCGYIEDTQTSERSLDVVRLRWADASSWGFCVLPLDRFLEGA
jgi:hypothetical protein